MSYPRRKLDLNLLILERRSCEAMEYAARLRDPNWDFRRFEALHFGTMEHPEMTDEYDAFRVLSQAEEYLDELDRQIPFLLPLERGQHYAWELFVELPRVGGSRSTRQLWNRLARAMSDVALPMETDEFIERYSERLQELLSEATDMGDRFYLADLDYGGWNGGIISKDFLVDGLEMLAAKLKSPVYDRGRKDETEKAPEEVPKDAGAGAPEKVLKEVPKDAEAEAAETTGEAPGAVGVPAETEAEKLLG
ncbi:MAG: hypothetical protein Q4C48_09960 [Lachnospiraceae bacterium]|nr:hypothetical protein [Lachnospiraceae bacterium]